VIRKRFDRWYRLTWEGKYENELRRQKLKVDVGFQHIRSEREMVKEIEVSFSSPSTTTTPPLILCTLVRAVGSQCQAESSITLHSFLLSLESEDNERFHFH
jgi:hypothetical protein